MIPLTVNPEAVILLNPEGKVEAVATNVAPDLKITVTSDPATYREKSLGKSFDSTRGN